MGLCIKANNRSNGIVNRHLQETPGNSWEFFEETARYRSKSTSRWNCELEIKVEALLRAGVFDPIYDLLLGDKGSVEQWAKILGHRYSIDWCELFSDFQFHLFNMLDGIADKAYNREISFMNNLYKQLESLTKDKQKYYKAKKRKDDWNCIPTERLMQIPDKKDDYADSELLLDLQNMAGVSVKDKMILAKLATGEIGKQDIPTVLGWSNKNDRKKLLRYMSKLAKILAQI